MKIFRFIQCVIIFAVVFIFSNKSATKTKKHNQKHDFHAFDFFFYIDESYTPQ
jgi:hypothetical protein